MSLTYLYGLRDPETKLIRYIGKSDRPRRRLSRHLCRAKRGDSSHNYNWIRKLLAEGLRPELVFLMQVPSESWKQVEKILLKSLKESGHDLTNTAEGGYGGPTMNGRVRTKETRRKISEGHKKLWTEEHRMIWSERAKEQHKDLEFKKKHQAGLNRAKPKISRAQKRRWDGNKEAKEKQSEVGKKIWKNAALRRQISDSVRKRWQDPEYRERQRKARIKAWKKRRVIHAT